MALLSDRGREALMRLMEHDVDVGAQRHVYADWPKCGEDDDGKVRLAEQVRLGRQLQLASCKQYITLARFV